MIKILVLGATGMLGSTLMRYFSGRPEFHVTGTVRSRDLVARFTPELQRRIIPDIEATNLHALVSLFDEAKPDVVINCCGIVKQVPASCDTAAVIAVNARLPHQLGDIAAETGARLIQISTDCVFSGDRGNYAETDRPDSIDLYGLSKLLGEVHRPRTLTLRTSLIGHEIGPPHGLVEWFLAQTGPVKGYVSAIFSGLPAVELARLIEFHVLPRPDLEGVWHVASEPITKYNLLKLVAEIYGRTTLIVESDIVRVDRSLDGMRFRTATGYEPPAWPELVRAMQDFG